MYSYDSQKELGASTALTGTGDLQTLTPAVCIEIISWGVIVTTALSGTPMVLALDKRITAGSDTGRVDDLAIMTLTSAQVTAAVAGFIVRNRPAPGVTAEQAILIYPGQQAIIEQATAMGSAGNGLPFIEFKISPQKAQFNAGTNNTINGVNAAVGLGNEIEQDT